LSGLGASKRRVLRSACCFICCRSALPFPHLFNPAASLLLRCFYWEVANIYRNNKLHDNDNSVASDLALHDGLIEVRNIPTNTNNSLGGIGYDISLLATC